MARHRYGGAKNGHRSRDHVAVRICLPTVGTSSAALSRDLAASGLFGGSLRAQGDTQGAFKSLKPHLTQGHVGPMYMAQVLLQYVYLIFVGRAGEHLHRTCLHRGRPRPEAASEPRHPYCRFVPVVFRLLAATKRHSGLLYLMAGILDWHFKVLSLLFFFSYPTSWTRSFYL